MGFFITEEKELPEFSNTDANKVLKVDSSGVYLEWLQETTSPAELPSQTGNSGRLLTTNGSTPSWTDAPTVSSLTSSGNINFSANDLQLRRSGNLFMRMSDSELGGTNRKIEFCAGGGVRRFLVTASTVDVETVVFSVLKNDAIHSIAGILNLPTAGSASAPSLMFGDNILTPVANRSGIWGSDDNVFFGTQGVQRVNINNTGMIISGTLDLGGNGTNANPSLMFGDNTAPKSGIYGTNGVINFTTEGTERMRIGQNFNDSFQTVTTNQRFQSPDGDTGGYRFANSGDNRIVCNNNVVSLRANGANTLSVSNTGATITGNLNMSGSTGGIGVVASTADAAGLYSTTNTTTGIRFNNTNNNLRILCNTQNIIDCTRNSGNSEGLASMEEVLQIKKCVRTPMLEVNADFTMAVLTPKFLRVDIANGNQVINFGAMPTRCEGQYHTILPFKSSVNGNRLYITTAGSTTAEIHYYENRVKTVITGNTQFEIFEGVVYQCIYKSTSASTGIWYFWPDCNSASQGVITVTGIEFGGAGSYITGTSAGQSSTMSMQLNGNTVMSTTQNDFYVQNNLKLSKAPTSDFFIVDFDNYAISRDSPKKIILTRQPEGSGTTQITFPEPSLVPGLEIEVIVWNLPNKNGSGKKRIRFTEVSAFVIGATNHNMMAIHSTNYEVAEGTWFTANCIRTSNNVVGQTVNRWFLRARQWVVPSGASNILTILANADT